MSLTTKEHYIFIVSAIFLNGIMGNVLFFFWKKVESILEQKGMIRTCSVLLRMVVLAFVIPSSIIVLQLFFYDCDVFSVTPTLQRVFFAIGILWIPGFIKMLIRTIKMQSQWKQLLKTSCECEKGIEELKEQCRRELGIIRKVQVRESYKVPVPLVFDVRNPMILLPVKEYAKEELKVIFFHELTHCKHQDIFWKRICGIIHMIFWWNPCILELKKFVDSWNESYCDFSCVDRLESKKNYFYTICNIGTSSFSKRFYFCAALCEEKDQIKTRILRVKAMPKKKKVNTKTMMRVSICFLMIAVSTMFLSAIGYKRVYIKAAYATEEAEYMTKEETERKMNLKEYHYRAKTENALPVVKTEKNPSMGEHISFVQKAGANTRMETDQLYLKQGMKVEIWSVNSHINSENKKEKALIAGISDSHGEERCVMHTDTADHIFYISESGTYKLFVENRFNWKEDIGMTFYIEEE